MKMSENIEDIEDMILTVDLYDKHKDLIDRIVGSNNYNGVSDKFSK